MLHDPVDHYACLIVLSDSSVVGEHSELSRGQGTTFYKDSKNLSSK